MTRYRQALERHITKMNTLTWMALQAAKRGPSARVISGAGAGLREAASRVRLYPWGLGVTFPPLGGAGGACAHCAAPCGAEPDTALVGEPICGKCATIIRAESDPPEGD